VVETTSFNKSAAHAAYLLIHTGFQGIFSAITFFYWVIRLKRLKKECAAPDVPMTIALHIRAMISAAIDSDEPAYVVVKMAAQSFLFLGGLQLDYQLTFSVMLGYFAFESCGDSLRVIIAFNEGTSISDLVVASSGIKSQIRQNTTTQLKPTNVYEDLSRNKTVVFMVFVTQCVLISFVVSSKCDEIAVL
jgi:hypothetical protein